jgi:predicted nucleotide-binding protein
VLPFERQALIREISNVLISLPEREIDDIFRAVGTSKMTPSGWHRLTYSLRRLSLSTLLGELADNTLEQLETFIPEIKEEIDTRTEPFLEAVETSPREAAAQDSAKQEQDSAERTSNAPPIADVQDISAAPIFLVHGHDHAVLHETVRVLERGTGREVTVLHEQANAGRTILEKFEHHAAVAAFAVVLLTADDEGGVRTDGDMHLRGRQNVIFELGFFFGKLGRQRVAVLFEENVEKPSDVDGLVYITLDKSGAWKYKLAKELEVAGISVDRSRIP